MRLFIHDHQDIFDMDNRMWLLENTFYFKEIDGGYPILIVDKKRTFREYNKAIRNILDLSGDFCIGFSGTTFKAPVLSKDSVMYSALFIKLSLALEFKDTKEYNYFKLVNFGKLDKLNLSIKPYRYGYNFYAVRELVEKNSAVPHT